MSSESQRHTEYAHQAADLLSVSSVSPRVLIGFDGFLDTMVDVVSQRFSSRPHDFEPIATITQFAARIAAASGVSTNLEVRGRQVSAGGNGPYMADAMARLGCRVNCIGALGLPDIHEKYADLASRCERVWSLADPARTDAIEFRDGKIMLNHPDTLDGVNWMSVLDCVGADAFCELLDSIDLLATVNWTNLSGLPSIWQGIREQPVAQRQRGPVLFVDLADPARRTDADVLGLLGDLQLMQERMPVVLGLNLAESDRLSRLAGITNSGQMDHPAAFADAASALQAQLGLHTVIVHNRRGCGAASAQYQSTASQETAWLPSRLVEHPKVTTGAGDHFNGGFAAAHARGFPLGASLAAASTTATLYVRLGAGPSQQQLVSALREHT